MLGQGTITLDNKTWQVSLAADPVDLAQGLGGLASLTAGTGELFDLGQMQTIQVTTVPMLFNLDIAFLDQNLKVTEVCLNIAPGYIITSQQPARYFLEVNAGDLASINPSDQSAEVITTPPVITTTGNSTGWTSILDAVMPLLMLVAFMGMLIPLTKSLFSGETRSPQLLADTRKKGGGKFRIKTDRMGDIIITHSQRPGKDVFLQLESDRELVYDLLKPAERRDLETGWNIEIPDSEPRASILNELWETAVNSDIKPKLAAKLDSSSQREASRKGLKATDKLDYLPDDQEFMAYTIDDIGYREKIDNAFRTAIQRARGS